MALDRTSLRIAINEAYQRAHDELGDVGAYQMLDQARSWSDATELYEAPAPTWAAGGFIKFEKVGPTSSSLPSETHA